MATKPTYHVYRDITVIDYDKLDFDPNEPEPLPDAMEQNPAIFKILHVIDAHLKSLHLPESVFLDSNTNLCYDPADPNRRILPDLYFAVGVDAEAIRRKRMYLPWEAGKPPDFALEVASPSTFRNDLGRKRDLYARVGVPECWRFDPTGGDYYGEPLVGERLINGMYRPIELTTEPDGVLKGYSPVLQRSLCWNDGMPELFDPVTGGYHVDLTQALIDLNQTLGEAAAERMARQEAEARIRRLEAELERHRQGS